MKILFTCLSKSWGGMEMYTLTSLKQLLKRNIKVELLCISESRLHIEANNLGIIIHAVKARGYFHPIGTIKTAALIRKGNYDLIHSHFSKDLWLLVPALNLLKSKIPLLLTKHVGSFILKKDKLHKWIYNRVNLAFAISKVIKKNLIETTPLKEEKIVILHNGIDTKKFDPEKVDEKKVRNEFKIKDDEIVIGMIARFSPGKGHEEFIEAAQNLNAKYSNLKFLISGEASRGEESYANKIKKMSEDKKLKNIIFTGFRTDIPEIIASMDIFVFPSHAEAFGIALIEAFSMGKPSVCSNTDGVLDIAVDNETSFLFENKNSTDLTNKIMKLIESPETRKIFGMNARKRAVSIFDFDIITDKVIKLYEKMRN